MLSVTSVMVLPPYLGCTLYLWQISRRADFPEQPGISRKFALFCGVAGSIYAIWMIYAGGLKYLMMAFVFQLIGIPVFLAARKKAAAQGETAMSEKEKMAAWLIAIISLLGIILFASGKIKL